LEDIDLELAAPALATVDLILGDLILDRHE
jgi:hypothetical protein